MKMNCIVFAVVLCIGLCACQRNATIEQSVTFNGAVYKAHLDTTTNLIINDGVCPNATVTCINYPSSSKTNSTGNYSLTISAVRTFSAPNADIYSIQAVANGGDEKVTAYGKPGDTIAVRDIMLYQHTEEK